MLGTGREGFFNRLVDSPKFAPRSSHLADAPPSCARYASLRGRGRIPPFPFGFAPGPPHYTGRAGSLSSHKVMPSAAFALPPPDALSLPVSRSLGRAHNTRRYEHPS